MKKRKLFCTLLVLSNLLFVSGCNGNNNNNNSSSSEPISSTEKEEINFTFKGTSVVYDGNAHSLTATDVPAGYEVSYSGNNYTEPGIYVITCEVTSPTGAKTSKIATLTIEKKESVLTAEAIQEAYAYGGAVPSYSLNNTDQVVEVNPIYKEGEYTIELFAKETDYYKESNHVVVNLTVKKGNPLAVTFDSKEVLYDGGEKELLAANIPNGYRAEYKNNKHSEPGKYNATCEIFDTDDVKVLTLYAQLEIDRPKNQEFEEYLNEFLVDYVGNDYFSWNIFMVNPETFGFIRDASDVATWYTYETIEDSEYEEAYEDNQYYKSLLTAFDKDDLSNEQLVSYRVIENLFDEYIEFYNPENGFDHIMNLYYIDQFGGYVAEFGTYMEAYELRTKQDIIDVLSYTNSLPTAFASYLVYAVDRAEKGYPISDYTIDSMVEYLEEVEAEGDNYYLTAFVQNKIDACEFLTDVEKANYKADFAEAMKNSFMPAVTSLKEGLADHKGKCTVEGYLASYGEVGKNFYLHDLRNLLGIPDLDENSYRSYLEKSLNKYAKKVNDVVAKYRALNGSDKEAGSKFQDYLNGESLVGLEDPNEMMEFLKEFAPSIVPNLKTTPEINIKYMDESVAKVSNAVAYYMKSPLDSTLTEHITLNGITLSDNYNSAISTLAHEGYPGHLYAYVYTKQLDIANVGKIMTSTAHGEGWANYVALKLWQYMKENNVAETESEKKAAALYCDYMYYNDLAAYLLYSLIDFNIHTLGWDIEDCANLLDSKGFNGSAAKDIYRTLIEMPAGYHAYGYGMSYFVDIHEQAQEALGTLYDEVEFNAALLSEGWCPLSRLQEIVDEYIDDKLYVNGLKVSE